ncbi:hypothetical protein [Microbispora sp. NPDC049125]|uniref:hypothetical protein n=1 Tax=Microbispora sp. NPDC049125 TaxID=3154929 RepID=UPI003466035D
MTDPAFTHRYCGSDKARAERGNPGHCEPCARYGHIAAHPELGCADVGCESIHNSEPTESRLATIDRAVMYLENTDPDELAATLAYVDMRAYWKRNLDELAAGLRLASPTETLSLFGKWKTAQRILQAAGLSTD